MIKRITLALAFAALAALALPSTAPAHDWDTFYSGLYPRAYQDIDYFFASDFPTGRRRARVVEAGRAWNNAPGALFFRAHRRGDVAPGFTCSRRTAGTGEPIGRVNWDAIDGPLRPNGGLSVLARAGYCTEARFDGTSNRIAYAFRARVDKSESWFYRSARGIPGRVQPDLRGTMTHEFGHAVGHEVHFDDGGRDAALCAASNPDPATMCGETAIGGRAGTRFRTLQRHDLHTFRSAYRSPLVTTMRTLTVTKAGTGAGTVKGTRPSAIVDCGPDCTESLNNGTEVHLTATAAPGSKFVSWSGDVSCMGGNDRADCRFYLQGANRTITARFDPA